MPADNPATDPADAGDFTVHVDADDLARQDLAAAVPPLDAGAERMSREARRHGARDERLTARQQSERARAGRRDNSAGSGRSYAFRRS